MTQKRFLENSMEELFEWCSVIIDSVQGYGRPDPAIDDPESYEAQRLKLEIARAAEDLRGLRIASVDLFHRFSGANEQLVATINDALSGHFGERTALIPHHHELD